MVPGIRNGIRKGLSSVLLCFHFFKVHGNPVLWLFWDTISESFLHCFGVFLDTISAAFWDTILAPFWNILSGRSQCLFGYVVPHFLDTFLAPSFRYNRTHFSIHFLTHSCMHFWAAMFLCRNLFFDMLDCVINLFNPIYSCRIQSYLMSSNLT